MPVVAAAQQLAELGPVLEGGQPRVRGHEALCRPGRTPGCPSSAARRSARRDGPGRRSRRPSAGSVRRWPASPVVRFGCHRDDVRVGADERVVGARLVAEALDHRQRVRGELVLGDAVARVGPREHHLPRAWPLRRTAAAALLGRRGNSAAPSQRQDARPTRVRMRLIPILIRSLRQPERYHFVVERTAQESAAAHRDRHVLLAVLAHVGRRNGVSRHARAWSTTTRHRSSHRTRGSSRRSSRR